MGDVYNENYDSLVGGDRLGFISGPLKKITGAAMFIGIIGAMSVWAYELGTRNASDVPIIRAMEGPARIVPEDPGGLTAEHQGLEVNSVMAGAPAPAPREAVASPAPQALAEEDVPQADLLKSVQTAMVQKAMEDAQGDPLQADATETASVESADALLVNSEETAVIADGSRPIARPRNLSVVSASPKQETPQASAEPRETASVAPGARMVQLGAFDSADLTRSAWSSLVATHPNLLGDKSLYVERTTSNARVFYRLRVAGFENAEETRVMCEALRGKGVDCIPVTLQ